jgi:hypothetical protein
MPKLASIFVVMLGAAALAALSAPSKAAQQAPAASPTPKGFECHDKTLEGSGAGFKSSQEESEAAAIADWLEKAKAVYPDATWETAKDQAMQCVSLPPDNDRLRRGSHCLVIAGLTRQSSNHPP